MAKSKQRVQQQGARNSSPLLAKLEKHHHELNKNNRAPIERWIGHPQVRARVLEHRSSAFSLVQPFDRFFNRWWDLRGFILYCLDAQPRFPDGSLEPEVFDVWPLSPEERVTLEWRIRPTFKKVLTELAQALANDGVPLDPRWYGTHFVLAQLLLLNVDFGLPPKKLAREIIGLPPVTLAPDEEGGISVSAQ